MPQTVYTAYDTTGQTKMTDMDQVAEQRRREMQDQAFRGALLNNQNNMQREGWGRQDALTQQQLGAQERIAQMGNQTNLAIQGAYGDRAANSLALAREQMTPARMQAELEANKWNEGAGLRGAKNEWEMRLQKERTSLLDGLSGGQSAQPGQPQRPGLAEHARMALLIPGYNRAMFEDPGEAPLRQALASKLASGEISEQQYRSALSGDYSAMPKKQVTAISPEMQIQSLQGDVQRFGERDAATIGFDPTEDDVSRIISQRDQVAQALRAQNPRLDPAQAIEGANFYIEEKLKPNADRWGTEWIAKLRQALRSGGGSMMNAQIGGMGSTSDRGY